VANTLNAVKKLQRKAQALLGVDLGYFAENIPGQFMSEAFILGCSFLTSVILARLTSLEVYGQYQYYLSILGLLTIFSLPGMNTAVNQAVARGHDQVFIEGVKARLRWSVLGSVAIFGIGIYYHLQGSTTLSRCFMVSAVLLPPYFSFDTLNYFLYGKMKFNKSALYRSIIKIIETAVVITVIVFSGSLFWIVLAYILSFSATGFFFLARTVKSERLNQSMDKEAIAYGKRLTLIGIIPTLANQYDKLIIANFLGFDDLAIYSVALIVQNITVPFDLVQNIAFPKLASMDKEAAKAAIRKKGLYLVGATGLVCAIAILITPYLIPLLYTSRFASSIFYAQLIVVSVFFRMPGANYALLFKTQKGITQLLKIGIFTQVLKIILLTVLVPEFGLLGAVVTILVYNLSVSLLSVWLARKL